MKLGPSRRGSIVLPAMIALMVMAVVGFAVAGQRIAHPPRHVARHVSEGGRHADDARTGEGEGPAPGSGSSATRGGVSSGVSEACAAVVSTGEGAAETSKGLTHAIDVLLTNCQRNDEAQGLLQALQRLQDAKGQPGSGHQGSGHQGSGPTESGNGRTGGSSGGPGGANDAPSSAPDGGGERPPPPRGQGGGKSD